MRENLLSSLSNLNCTVQYCSSHFLLIHRSSVQQNIYTMGPFRNDLEQSIAVHSVGETKFGRLAGANTQPKQV